jgi:hypothetical protein
MSVARLQEPSPILGSGRPALQVSPFDTARPTSSSLGPHTLRSLTTASGRSSSSDTQRHPTTTQASRSGHRSGSGGSGCSPTRSTLVSPASCKSSRSQVAHLAPLSKVEAPRKSAERSAELTVRASQNFGFCNRHQKHISHVAPKHRQVNLIPQPQRSVLQHLVFGAAHP